MRALVLALVVACGGDSSSQRAAAPPPVPASTPAATPSPAPVAAPLGDRIHRHRTLPVGAVNIYTIDVSADGSQIAAVGEEGGLIVVDRESGKVVRRVPRARQDVAAISADGTRVVGGVAKGIALHDIASGKQLAKRPGETAVVRCGDGYLLADDKHARVVDRDLRELRALPVAKLTTYSPIACHREHAAVVAGWELVVFSIANPAAAVRVAIPPNGDVDGSPTIVAIGERHVAAMTNWGSVWLYDHAGKLLAFRPHIGGQAQDLAFSPDGQTLAAGIALLSVPDLAIRARTPGTRALRYTPDGQWLVIAGTYDLQLLDVGALREHHLGHVETAHTMSIDPSGTWLASGSAGRVYLWKLADAKPGAGPGPLAGVIDAHPAGVFDKTSVAFHPDGKRLVTAAAGTVAVWDLATRRLLDAAITVGDSHETELALAVDAKHAVALGNSKVHVFDVSGKLAPVTAFALPWKDEPWSVGLHPDGKHVVISARDGHAGVFERTTGKLVASRAPAKDGSEMSLSVGPDGKVVLFGWGATRLVGFPKLEDKSRVDEPGRVDQVAWTKNGAALAWASWSGNVGVLDVTASGLRARWQKHTPWHSAAMAWDEKRGVVYSSGADDSIHVWDAKTGALRASWIGGRGAGIDHAVLVKDTLVTVQDDIRSVRVWDLTKPAVVANLHSERVDLRPKLAGDRLITFARGTLVRWQRDGGTWKRLPDWKPPTEFGWFGLAIAEDGKTAYVIDTERSQLVTLDVATAKPTATRKTALVIDDFRKRAADPTATYLAVQTETGAELWDLAKNKRLHVLTSDDVFHGFTFVGDEVVLKAAEERKRWSIKTGKTRLECPRDEFANELGYSADGTRAVYLRAGVMIRSTSRCTDDMNLYVDDGAYAAAIDGDRLALVRRGEVEIWDLAKRAPVAILLPLRDGLWAARTATRTVAPERAPLPETK